MRKQIEELLKSEVTGYSIAKKTGIGESVISNLRSGKRNLDNISLKNAELLYNYQKEIEKMNELNSKMIEDVVLGEVELVEGLQQYFIDIEGDYEYNVEFATLSEVDYKVCALYEV
uniref:hypothetical protein n=1 Tax=Staphylococcus haemolyticus TaxID=1283 RepID=UPI00214DA385